MRHRAVVAVVGLALILVIGLVGYRTVIALTATPLSLSTASASEPIEHPQLCPPALSVPLVGGQADGRMIFRRASDGTEAKIVWPRGFSARLVYGKAELVDANGNVAAREGDTLSIPGGGAPGDEFDVCFP
jgi:hypothetical protein